MQDALALFALSAALLLGGSGFVRVDGLLGVALVQWVCLGLPALVGARLLGGSMVRVLGLTRAPVRALVGAVLVGLTAWLPLVLLLAVQEQFVPAPASLRESLEQLVSSRGGSIWPVLAALALAPAVCEELLCRGVVARALARPLGLGGATVVSALLFALLHGSAYRLVPTFLLGLVLGVAALRQGSLLPAILLHGAHNAMLVFIESDSGAAVTGALARAPMVACVLVAAALGGLLLGLRLLFEVRVERGQP